MLGFTFFKQDVTLSINNFGPLFGKIGQKRVVVVHDVWFMSDVYEGGKLSKYVFRLLLALQLWNTHTVVTVSKFSKDEIIKYFNFSPDKIVVVPNCLFQEKGNRPNNEPLSSSRIDRSKPSKAVTATL